MSYYKASQLFVFSHTKREAVKPFFERFSSNFFLYADDNSPLYHVLDKRKKHRVYTVPEWETDEALQAVIDESMREGKDLVLERYKDFEHTYDPEREFVQYYYKACGLFVFGWEGYEYTEPFCKRFDSIFYFSEPGGGAPIYETPDKEYEIPEWETNEALQAVIDESMRQGKDLLVERYKDFEFILDPNVTY